MPITPQSPLLCDDVDENEMSDHDHTFDDDMDDTRRQIRSEYRSIMRISGPNVTLPSSYLT